MNALSSAWEHPQEGAGRTESANLSLRTLSGRRTAELFEEWHAPLLRYLYSLTRHPAEAEDLLQETFLRFFRELQNGHTVRDPKAWLFTTAHNLAMDYHRRAVSQESPGTLPAVPDTRDNAEEEMVASERREWLSVALGGLSAQQKQCIELRAEGLRYREIAGILGLHISTVRTFIVRAVTHLAGGPK